MATRTISASIRLDGERQFNRAMEEVNRNLRAMSAEVKASESAFQSQGRNMDTLRNHQRNLQNAYDQTKEKVRILREQLRDLTANQQENSVAADRVRASLGNAEASMNRYEAAINRTTAEIEELEQAQKDTASGMEELGDKTEAAGGKMNTMSVALGSLLANMAQRGVSLLKDIGQVGIQYNAQIESYTMAMTTALGSAEAAAEAIANIKLDAALTPYSVDALVRANQLLIAAGESAEGARATVMALSDAVSATGGGNDELMRMAQNLQQIQNVGKASAMDIRQFQMAGIDVYGILADYTGMATEEVSKLTVTYELLSQALQAAASEGGRYFGANAAQAATLNGQISTLKDNIRSQLGNALQGVSNTLSGDLLPKVNEFVSGLDMDEVVAGFMELVNAAGAVGGAIAAVQAARAISSWISAANEAITAFGQAAISVTTMEEGLELMSGKLTIAQMAYGVLTGQISAATVGQLALNAAVSFFPAAILVAGFTAVAIAGKRAADEIQALRGEIAQPILQSDSLEDVGAQLEQLRQRYADLKNEINENGGYRNATQEQVTEFEALSGAIDDVEAHYGKLQASAEAAAQAEVEHQAYLDSTAGKIKTLTDELQELQEAYDKAYESARESMLGQFDLFDQVEPVTARSTEDIIKALESQADYFNAYSDNLTTLQGMTADSIGLNADLVASLSDGSDKSVQAAATIAQGYQKALAQGDEAAAAYIENLNTAWEAQQDAASRAAEAMVQDQKAAVEQMKLEIHKLRLDQQAEARAAGTESAQAGADSFSDGMEAAGPQMRGAARQAGASVNAAFQEGLNSRSLSLPPVHYSGGGFSGVAGSFATGLDYVPYDGFIAELHRGEMVVPAAAAEGLRQGGSVKNEINIYTQELSQSTMDYIYASIVERAGDEL